MRNLGKAKLILTIILIVLLIALGVVVFLNARGGTSHSTDYEGIINEVADLYINGGSKKELEEVTGIKNLETINIITGPDSYTRSTPGSKIIKSNNLESYVDKANNLSNNLEKVIKDDFEYSIAGFANQVNQKKYTVDIKSYFYYVYMFDLDSLRDMILTNSGAINNEANQYKAKVKAMEILDRHLDTYRNVNNDEVIAVITYDYKNEKNTSQSLYSYLLIMEGENYLHSNDTVTNLMVNQSQRIQDYYNYGITEGILNSNDLLAL